jgi:hypothetical protein
MSGHTEVNVSPVTTIGVSTPVTVRLANPHGVRAVDAWLEQEASAYPLFEEKGRPPAVLEAARSARRVTFEAGKNKAPELKEGQSAAGGGGRSNDFARQHRFRRAT